MKIEITELTKDDIITILSEAFKLPMWRRNNAVKVTNELLNEKRALIYNSKDYMNYALNLESLYNGLEKFILKIGNTNIDRYDYIDGDFILQYALFGVIVFENINKNRF